MTETPTSTHELVVIIRPSFKKLCDDDACRAALFNHLLYWIAQKAKGQPANKVRNGEVYWYGSYEDICGTGLADSWTMWKVRKEIPLLVNSGIMGQRHNPTKGFDRTFQYFFGLEQGKALKALCQKHEVKLLEIGLQADVLHLLKTANAFVESSTCISQKQQIHLLNPADANAESSRAIPKVTNKGTSKDFNKERESLNRQTRIIPPTDALSLSEKKSSEETLKKDDQQRREGNHPPPKEIAANAKALERVTLIKQQEDRLEALKKRGTHHA